MLSFSWLHASNFHSFHSSQEVLAQSSKDNSVLIKINVQVSNNGSTNLIGLIHIMSATANTIKNASDIIFPAVQTIIKIFEFNPSEISDGTDFRVEMIYGNDYYKRSSGLHNQSNNGPAFISINTL